MVCYSSMSQQNFNTVAIIESIKCLVKNGMEHYLDFTSIFLDTKDMDLCNYLIKYHHKNIDTDFINNQVDDEGIDKNLIYKLQLIYDHENK